MDKNELDARKLSILKAVIDEYVESFEPVGSRTLSKNEEINLSSATIRNEMADLEEMGFLVSPHTSSGRVPSTKGYRAYVDKIMAPIQDDPEICEDIITKLEGKRNEYSKLIKACTEIISEMTHYAAIGVTRGNEKFVIKAVQLVPVDGRHVLIVIVAENNGVKNKVIELTEELTADKVIELSSVVNSICAGKTCENISILMLNQIVDISGLSRTLILPIIDGIISCVEEYKASEVYTWGTSNLLKSPEFDDVSKTREFIDLIQDREKLESIANATIGEDSNVRITIGTENAADGMNDYSIVTAKYEIDGVPYGTISVVGPTRMDYKKVVSTLEYMRKTLENEHNTKK